MGMAKKAVKTVIANPDHEIADMAGMERQNLYGWQVTRGKTRVELRDGTSGVILDWMGGHFRLDNGVHSFVDEIVAFE
jgi:hypothetical protein